MTEFPLVTAFCLLLQCQPEKGYKLGRKLKLLELMCLSMTAGLLLRLEEEGLKLLSLLRMLMHRKGPKKCLDNFTKAELMEQF